MAKTYTTDTLVVTALRRAMIPSDQSTFTCCDIIDIMNEEMGIHVVPMVLRAHEEYYVIDEDQPVSTGVSRYKIPYRAVGNKLRDVSYVDGAGSYYEMTRISLEHRADYQCSYTGATFIPFYVENDDIVLLTNSSSSGSVRSSYYLRPNDLVKDTRGAKITAICVGCCSTTFTVSPFPSHFPCTTTFDFIQGRSPNKIIAFDRDRTCINSVTKTITFDNSDIQTIDTLGSADVDITFSVGDYIMKEGESIMPQLPAELRPILAQRTAIKLLEALGDTEGMRNAQQELERMEHNAMTLIDNRVEGAPQKANNRNGILKAGLSNKLYRRRGL